MKKREYKGMKKFRIEEGSFVIRDYQQVRPWASFFPGIAGIFGIPMWAFYVNRGQAMVSVGIHSKDEAIMEFWPANKAYQMVSTQGFRTFIKIKSGAKPIFYEPFSIISTPSSSFVLPILHGVHWPHDSSTKNSIKFFKTSSILRLSLKTIIEPPVAASS